MRTIKTWTHEQEYISWIQDKFVYGGPSSSVSKLSYTTGGCISIKSILQDYTYCHNSENCKDFNLLFDKHYVLRSLIQDNFVGTKIQS